MNTIRQIVEKIKLFVSSYTEELGVSAIVILVAFSCFYLGRASISASTKRNAGITIENTYASSTQAKISGENSGPTRLPTPAGEANGGQIIASKTGKRYYYAGCSGVSRISPANIVHYASAADAEKFGLTLASNCNPK
ncbi:MAG: hypothetical protein V4438_00895 [Patescibacteria group bacterium]